MPEISWMLVKCNQFDKERLETCSDKSDVYDIRIYIDIYTYVVWPIVGSNRAPDNFVI